MKLPGRFVFSFLALTACTVNGKSYGPGLGGGGGGNNSSGGSAPALGDSGGGGGGGARACQAEPLQRAHRNGMKGPCWDPPGRYETVPPVHVVPGVRAMERPPSGDDVYWIDMPKEATILGDGANCGQLPTGSAYVADTIAYEPYADEDGLPRPQLPDQLGEPVAKVLEYLDGLGTPFCVTVSWDPACEREPGTVCADERSPDESGGLTLRVAGKRPR